MQSEIVISGFGGQGALFAGQALAYAGLNEGKHVTWLPSYGPEMRGGTAHCIVIVSDDPIGSPVIRNPKAALVMNSPSMEKYEPLVKPGGLLVVNGSMVSQTSKRTDIQTIFLPANDLAEDVGDIRMTNIVMLGALLSALPVVSLEAVDKALEDNLPSRHRDLLEANIEALRHGAQEASEQFAPSIK